MLKSMMEVVTTHTIDHKVKLSIIKYECYLHRKKRKLYLVCTAFRRPHASLKL